MAIMRAANPPIQHARAIPRPPPAFVHLDDALTFALLSRKDDVWLNKCLNENGRAGQSPAQTLSECFVCESAKMFL